MTVTAQPVKCARLQSAFYGLQTRDEVSVSAVEQLRSGLRRRATKHWGWHNDGGRTERNNRRGGEGRERETTVPFFGNFFRSSTTFLCFAPRSQDPCGRTGEEEMHRRARRTWPSRNLITLKRCSDAETSHGIRPLSCTIVHQQMRKTCYDKDMTDILVCCCIKWLSKTVVILLLVVVAEVGGCNSGSGNITNYPELQRRCNSPSSFHVLPCTVLLYFVFCSVLV